MRTHADPWASQNNWQARQRHQETHDELPPKSGTSLAEATRAGWVAYADDAMIARADGRLTLAEAMGRVVKAARELSRQRPTEAELHDDVKHALEGE